MDGPRDDGLTAPRVALLAAFREMLVKIHEGVAPHVDEVGFGVARVVRVMRVFSVGHVNQLALELLLLGAVFIGLFQLGQLAFQLVGGRILGRCGLTGGGNRIGVLPRRLGNHAVVIRHRRLGGLFGRGGLDLGQFGVELGAHGRQLLLIGRLGLFCPVAVALDLAVMGVLGLEGVNGALGPSGDVNFAPIEPQNLGLDRLGGWSVIGGRRHRIGPSRVIGSGRRRRLSRRRWSVRDKRVAHAPRGRLRGHFGRGSGFRGE